MGVMAGDEPDLQDSGDEYITGLEKFISEGKQPESKKRKQPSVATQIPDKTGVENSKNIEEIEQYMMGMEKFISEGPPKKRVKYPCDLCGLGIFTSKANRNAHMKNNCKYRKVLEDEPTTEKPMKEAKATDQPPKPITEKGVKEPKMTEKGKGRTNQPLAGMAINVEPKNDDEQHTDCMREMNSMMGYCMEEMKIIELKNTLGYLMVPCIVNIPNPNQ